MQYLDILMQIEEGISHHVNDLRTLEQGTLVAALANGQVHCWEIGMDLKSYEELGSFQADEYGVTVHQVCEVSRNQLAVACYENLFLWDLSLSLEKPLCKL